MKATILISVSIVRWLSILMVMAGGIAHRVGAHTIWIEPIRGGSMAVRFAEPGNDFETSPGYLDHLSAPAAFSKAGTNAPIAVPISTQSDHFLLKDISLTNVVCVETVFTVRGGRKPFFYARWQPEGVAASSPALTLDLVPTGRPGVVRAYFRGEPLGGIAAILRFPDETEVEITADSEGFLHFDPKQSGQYLLAIAHHREPIAGFHRGRPYDRTSHNAALSWRQR